MNILLMILRSRDTELIDENIPVMFSDWTDGDQWRRIAIISKVIILREKHF